MNARRCALSARTENTPKTKKPMPGRPKTPETSGPSRFRPCPAATRGSVTEPRPPYLTNISISLPKKKRNWFSNVKIRFKNRRLEKTFNCENALKRRFGDAIAKKIALRMAVLRSVENLNEVPPSKPERRHQLTGKRKEQFAVDLSQPYRLVFEVGQLPVPRKKDGGIDLDKVNFIKILEVIDYH